MKKIILAILLIAPISLMAQKGNYTLKGQIGNLNAPAKVYLSYRTANVTVIDSTTITNGQFEFKGTVNDPIQANLIINRTGPGIRSKKSEYVSLYLEAGNIKISSPDSLEKVKITGSKINTDNEKLKLALKPNDQKLSAYITEYRAIPAEKKKDEAIQAELDKKYNAIDEEKKQILLTYIKANPKSFVSLSALKRYAGSVPDYADAAPLFNTLSEEVKRTITGKEYATYLEKIKAISIGAIAPEFSQNDPDGNVIKLSDFKGKYLLIDFWASWCGPCRAENPNVVKAYAKYHEKGLEILGVSLDTKKEAWTKAIGEDKLTWKHVSDVKGWDNEVAGLYAVRAIPQNVLIDANGKIIGKNLRGDALEVKLAELFK